MMNAKPEPSSCVPPDFPRGGRPGAIAGAHPKMLMREIDGRFVTEPTEDRVRTRYNLCADLVSQLKTYCERKHRENPDLDRLALLQKVRVEVRQKGWDLSEAELDWVMEQLGLPIDAKPRTLAPWQVAPAWLEAFLVRANDAPPVKGQLRTMLEATRGRSVKI